MNKILLICFVLFQFSALFGQVLTKREVYDLHVGDEIGLEIHGSPFQKRWKKVINREEKGTDSLILTYYVRNLEIRFQNNIFSDYTYVERIGQLDSPIFKNFIVGKRTSIDSIGMYIRSFTIAKDTIYTGLCNIEMNSRYRSFSSEAYDEDDEYIACKGLGVLRRHYDFQGGPGDGYRYYEFLQYFVKDGDTCGDKKNFPLTLSEQKIYDINIYPNPSKNDISIIGISNFHFSITNILGIQLQEGEAEEGVTIDVSMLARGIYFIEVNGQRQKLVID